MNGYSYYKFIYSISQFNILPLTSRCNYNCIFCSHRGNPPHIETVRIKDLTPEEFEDLAEYLNPEEKIVTGESATRIIEGEPFCNPYILDILSILRKKLPKTPLQITTNGSLLDEKTVKTLSELKNITLQVSVNTLSDKLRKKIMGENAGNIRESLIFLMKHKIPFSAGMVIMPSLTGWEEIEETIKFLSKTSCRIIKVFLPSFTSYTPHKDFFHVDINELQSFFRNIKEKVYTPILIEPPLLKDLRAFSEGSVKRTPSYRAGIRAGDEIISINRYRPFSRADAFRKINSLKNPELIIKRNGDKKNIKIHKKESKKSGITFLYDLERDMIKNIKKSLRKNSIVITSKLAFKILKCAFKKENIKAPLIPAENHFFGGTIGCAGLLTTEDIINALENEKNFSHIILPSAPFDEKGVDLRGKSYLDIQDKTGASVTLI